MEKLFTFSLLLLLCTSSCIKKEQTEVFKARVMIRTWLDEEVGVNEYKILEWGFIDSTFTSVKTNSTYHRFAMIEMLHRALNSTYLADAYEYSRTGLTPNRAKFREIELIAQAHADTAAYYKQMCDSVSEQFNYVYEGKEMQVIYEAKNEKGKTVVFKWRCYFNFEVTRMIEVEFVFKNLQLSTFEENRDYYKIKKIKE